MKGTRLTVSTDSNSLFVFVGGGLALLAFNEYILYEQRGDDYRNYWTFMLPDSKYGVYRIVCHRDFTKDKTKEYEKLVKAKNKLCDRYGLVWSGRLKTYTTPAIANDPMDVNEMELEEFSRLWAKIKEDQEYKKIAKQLTWESLPIAVQETGKAVMTIHDYLFDVRKLKPLTGTVYVILRDTWPYGASVEAMEEKKSLLNPTIMINPDTIKSIVAGKTGSGSVKDELYVTLAHETFHAVQHKYFDKNTIYQDLRFAEATAVLLEGEAAKYFKDKKIISSYNPTFGEYSWLTRAWTEELTKREDEQSRGYAFSRVLAFQRDSLATLFSSTQEKYLERLLNARAGYYLVGSWVSGVDASVASIYNTLHKHDKELMYRYMHSVAGREAAVQLVDSAKATDIKTAEKEYSVKMNDLPLTVVPYSANLNSSVAGVSDPKSILLYQMDLESRALLDAYGKHILFTDKQVILYKPNDVIKWKEIGNRSGVTVVPISQLKSKKGITSSPVFVTDDFQTSGYNDQPDLNMRVVLAVPPDKVKTLKYDEDSMSFIIEVEPMKSGMTDLIKGRSVEITVPGTSIKPYKKLLEPGVDQTRIHVVDLLLNDGDSGSMFNTIAGKMVTGMMTANMRGTSALMAASSQGMVESKWDGDAMYLGIKESFTITNSKGEAVSPAQELKERDMPHGIHMSVNADTDVTATISADNGAYIRLTSSLEDTFRYMRYMVLPFGTGANMDKAMKRLKELDSSNKVVCTVRNVYSEEPVSSLREAVKSENSHNQTAKLLLGPESPEKDMKSPRIDSLPSGLQDGLYQGKNLFRMTTNLNDVIRSTRDATRDQRINDTIEKRLNEYVESSKARHKAMSESDGAGAVYSDIEIQRAKIKADVIKEDMEFDSDFYVNFQKAVDDFNKMTYTFQISGNKAVLTVFNVSMDCTIAAGSSQGQYKLTAKLPDKSTYTFDMVMLPNGNLIIKGEPVILERK